MKHLVLPPQPSVFLETQVQELIKHYQQGVRTFTRVSLKGGRVEIIAPNLARANLSHLDLREINLTKANLAQVTSQFCRKCFESCGFERKQFDSSGSSPC